MTSGYFANGGLPDEVDTEGGITLNGATNGRLLLERTEYSNDLEEWQRWGQAHNGTHVSLARGELAMADVDNLTNGGLTVHSGEPRVLVFTTFNGMPTKTTDQRLAQGRFRFVGITKGADIYGQDAKLQSGVALDIAGKRSIQYNSLRPCQPFDFLRIRVPSVNPDVFKREERRLADQRGPSLQSHGKYLAHLEPYVLGEDDGSLRDVYAQAIRRYNIISAMMTDHNVASGSTEASRQDPTRGDTRRLQREFVGDMNAEEHAALTLAQDGQMKLLFGLRGLLHAAAADVSVEDMQVLMAAMDVARRRLGVANVAPGDGGRKNVQENMRYVFRHQFDGALEDDDRVHAEAEAKYAEKKASEVIRAAGVRGSEMEALTTVERQLYHDVHADMFEAVLSFKAELDKDVVAMALTETEPGGMVDLLLLR